MYTVHHPDAYVKFVVDVLTLGADNLGTQRIPVPKTVREKRLAVAKMRISEWVPEASLRIGSNSLGNNAIHQGRNDNFIKNWNAGIAGATKLKEMRKWLQRVARAVLFRHLVTLASDILPTGDGQNYIAEVLTWGD